MSESGPEAGSLVILAEFSVPDASMRRFLLACADDAAGSVADEPGCQRFEVLVAENGAPGVTLVEVYDDGDAFEAHLRTPHYARFAAAVRALDLPPPTVRRLSRQHAGAA